MLLLDLFNANLSPERYWRGMKSPGRWGGGEGGEKETIPDATQLLKRQESRSGTELRPLCLPAKRPPAVGSCGRRNQVPSGENTELKRSPFQAWSRSVYSHTCYAYCQGFLPSGPFTCFFFCFFFQTSPNFSCVGCG